MFVPIFNKELLPKLPSKFAEIWIIGLLTRFSWFSLKSYTTSKYVVPPEGTTVADKSMELADTVLPLLIVTDDDDIPLN